MGQFIKKYDIRFLLPLSLFFLLVFKPFSSTSAGTHKQTLSKYSYSILVGFEDNDDTSIFEDIDDQDPELEKGTNNPCKFIKYVCRPGLHYQPTNPTTVLSKSKNYSSGLSCLTGKMTIPLRL